MLENICSKVIGCYNDDLLAGEFGIKKTREQVVRKYYWPTICQKVEVYIRGCDVCLTSKLIRHKLYGDLQSLSVLTHL